MREITLLSESQLKLDKSGTVGMSLLPADEFNSYFGRRVTASFCASAGTCKAGCLSTSSHGGMPHPCFADEREEIIPEALRNPGRAFFNTPSRARFYRCALWVFHPAEAESQLRAELSRVPRKIACRLNVISDRPWGSILDLSSFRRPFYDYTKIPGRVSTSAYRLAYSLNERTSAGTLERWEKVAVTTDTVSAAEALISAGYAVRKSDGEVIRTMDADLTDRWILDEPGRCFGILRPKGKLRKRPNAFSRAYTAFIG